MKNLFEKIVKHIKSNYIYYLISVSLIIISGSIGYKFLKLSPLDESSIAQVKNFMSWNGAINNNGSLVFADAFRSNLLMILAIWISGLTFIGIPIIVTILFIKGFSFGFTLAFITTLNTEPGFYKIVILLVLQNIFIFFCLIVAAVFSFKSSVNISKGNNDKVTKEVLKHRIIKNAGFYVIVMIFCFIEALFEGYILPIIF
ncbi:MAG: stage II sporulation protein M [Oscillospiraceae bacterium]|nr:stage II sporulation protein M [Oscillospiraceae bacterium]